MTFDLHACFACILFENLLALLEVIIKTAILTIACDYQNTVQTYSRRILLRFNMNAKSVSENKVNAML